MASPVFRLPVYKDLQRVVIPAAEATYLPSKSEIDALDLSQLKQLCQKCEQLIQLGVKLPPWANTPSFALGHASAALVKAAKSNPASRKALTEVSEAVVRAFKTLPADAAVQVAQFKEAIDSLNVLRASVNLQEINNASGTAATLSITPELHGLGDPRAAASASFHSTKPVNLERRQPGLPMFPGMFTQSVTVLQAQTAVRPVEAPKPAAAAAASGADPRAIQPPKPEQPKPPLPKQEPLDAPPAPDAPPLGSPMRHHRHQRGAPDAPPLGAPDAPNPTEEKASAGAKPPRLERTNSLKKAEERELPPARPEALTPEEQKIADIEETGKQSIINQAIATVAKADALEAAAGANPTQAQLEDMTRLTRDAAKATAELAIEYPTDEYKTLANKATVSVVRVAQKYAKLTVDQNEKIARQKEDEARVAATEADSDPSLGTKAKVAAIAALRAQASVLGAKTTIARLAAEEAMLKAKHDPSNLTLGAEAQSAQVAAEQAAITAKSTLAAVMRAALHMALEKTSTARASIADALSRDAKTPEEQKKQKKDLSAANTLKAASDRGLDAAFKDIQGTLQPEAIATACETFETARKETITQRTRLQKNVNEAKTDEAKAERPALEAELSRLDKIQADAERVLAAAIVAADLGAPGPLVVVGEGDLWLLEGVALTGPLF